MGATGDGSRTTATRTRADAPPRRFLAAAAALLLTGVDSSRARADLPITGGTVDDADDGVVGLVATGDIYCTGTLVAPRVVMTAAHCLLSTTVTSVLVGTDLATGRSIAAVYAFVHPDFDATSLRADVGLILLAEPATAAPLPLLAAPFDASFVGLKLRLVGFGQTSATDASPARKREGTATLASFTDGDFQIHPGPSLTCGGDSGAPAFLVIGATEYVAGVTSAGDVDCLQFTRSIRADRQLSFVADFVARTAAGASAPGERCFYQENCATGRCRFPADAPAVGYCSTSCRGDGDCASGMVCGAGECRYPEPSPGALGVECASYTDCDSLLCASGSCSVVCDAQAPSCPDGYECLPDSQHAPLEACFRAPSGGCAVAPSDAPPLYALLLIAIAIARARRAITARRAPSGPSGGAGTRTCSSG